MKVHIAEPGAPAPGGSTHYIIAKNGMLLKLTNEWLDAVVPVSEFKTLEEVPPRATLKLPPITALVMAQALAFFRAVYDEHRAEAAVLLHYSNEHGWMLSVPKQRVTYGTVKYDMIERIEGYRCVGTMHSHGAMPAFHSAVDVPDEAAFDGVHITMGNVNRLPRFSMDAEIVVRGARFPLPLEQTLGITKASDAGTQPYYVNGISWMKRGAREKGEYLLDMSVLANWDVPSEWMQQVEGPPRWKPFTSAVSTTPTSAAAQPLQTEPVTSVPQVGPKLITRREVIAPLGTTEEKKEG